MSYYSGSATVFPGPIPQSRATEGIQARVSIVADRILDSCMRQRELTDFNITLTNMAVGRVQPFVFTRAYSPPNMEATVFNVRVLRIADKPQFARVRLTVSAPIKVVYTDASGGEFTADSEVSVDDDVVLYIPNASIFPYSITATMACGCFEGQFINENTVSCAMCVTEILKVTTQTDLLIPTYGYCPTPTAVSYKDACNGIFELPLYPTGQ